MKSAASAFIKLFQKATKYNKRLEIHENGVENNYPDLVESRITESVTALRCKNLMAAYLSGKGFGDDLNKIKVNEKKGTTLLKFTQDIADSIASQNGVFIHVNYDLNFEITDMDVLPFSDCRIGKKDNNKYSGKILVCEDWSDDKKAKKAKVIDVFNNKKSVLEEQIDNAGSIKKYNGQIYYLKFGKYTYPYSPLHPCLDDADSEKQASVFKNSSLRKGFFGKTVVVTKPFVDPDIDKETEPELYREMEGERTAFRNTLKEFIGAENAEGVLHFEMELDGEDMKKQILFETIDTNIDDKLFAHTENSVSDNIRMCFNNVPAPLIKSQDGALFGSSGEAITAMKIFYQDQTVNERLIVEQIVSELMGLFSDNKQKDLKIIPLIEIKKEEVNADE